MKGKTLKRAIAIALTLLVISGSVPTSPVSDMLSGGGIAAVAAETEQYYDVTFTFYDNEPHYATYYCVTLPHTFSGYEIANDKMHLWSTHGTQFVAADPYQGIVIDDPSTKTIECWKTYGSDTDDQWVTLYVNITPVDAFDISGGSIENIEEYYQLDERKTVELDYNVKAHSGDTLTKGADYTAVLKKDGETVDTVTPSGNYTLEVNGTGSYHGSLIKEFHVYQTMPTDSDGNCLISSSDDWNTFVSNVSAGENTEGKCFKLMSDISVSAMVGTSRNPFKGTFDGNGKTVTVNHETSEDYCGLFRYIDGAEIYNLTVDGSVKTNAKYAGGLVGSMSGSVSIHDCICNVTINSNTEGMANHGGFIAVMEDNSSVTMDNCTFGGKLLGEKTEGCGGFIGWKNTNSTAQLSNCVFAPEELTVSKKGSFTFVRNSYDVYETCYFTQNLANKEQKKSFRFSADGKFRHRQRRDILHSARRSKEKYHLYR